jgi:hypothetical protein
MRDQTVLEPVISNDAAVSVYLPFADDHPARWTGDRGAIHAIGMVPRQG